MTFKLTKIPKKPTVESFRRSLTFASSNNLWPCPHCKGRGGTRDIRDFDPIEGYKLAPLYNCQFCDATGRATKKTFMASYKKAVEEWKNRAAKARMERAAEKEALAKLTKKDKRALDLA